MKLLLLLVAVAAPSVAWAERSPSSESLAAEAVRVHHEHCSDAAQDDVTIAAKSVAVVSDVWARVSTELESSRKGYLLYWRGVLGQCLDQEVKALADLRAFLDSGVDRSIYAQQLADARRRVKQLSRKLSGRSAHPGTAGFVAGGALAGGGAIAGVLAAWQWGQAQNVANELAIGVHIGNDV